MKYLVYCLVPSSPAQAWSPPPGVGGEPVFVLWDGDLGAAVSAGSDAQLQPDVPHLMAYERVVEYFHGLLALVPMRYGCLFDEPPQVLRCLREHHQEYRSLLASLDGMVEMGVRVLLHDGETVEPPLPAPDAGQLAAAGAAYLRLRNQHYASHERQKAKLQVITQSLRDRLSGHFVNSREESSELSRRAALLSLQFLVRRASVDSFAGAVRSLAGELPWKFLLSGPWPPYNFVDRPPHLG